MQLRGATDLMPDSGRTDFAPAFRDGEYGVPSERGTRGAGQTSEDCELAAGLEKKTPVSQITVQVGDTP
jgi:hypothetical protein